MKKPTIAKQVTVYLAGEMVTILQVFSRLVKYCILQLIQKLEYVDPKSTLKVALQKNLVPKKIWFHK